MTHSTDDLHVIGATLAAAGDGKSAELTDAHRTVLASAHTADVLFAIARHAPGLKRVTVEPDRSHAIANSLRTINEHLAPIASAWTNECRVAFGDPLTKQRIAAALSTDQPLVDLADFIREDNRLASYERGAILQILDSANSKRGDTSGNAAPPKVAYLSQLSVAGFRGIGQHAELNISPHPGLTIVYGANGSGKSSFAEALDVLFTGTTGRFAGRGGEWHSAQTNVHKPKSGYVRAVFALGAYEADVEPFVRSWTDGGHLAGAYDETPTEHMRALGWLDALDEFKPVLGYAELGPLLDEDAFGEVTDSEFADRRETLLARHIRLRAGISDPLLSSIQGAVQSNGAIVGQPFLPELTAWHRLSLARSRRGRRQPMQIPTADGLPVLLDQSRQKALAALAPLVGSKQSLPHPYTLQWNAFFKLVEKGEWSDKPNLFVRHMIAPLLDLWRAINEQNRYRDDRYRHVLPSARRYLGWTSRTHVYCEMLIEEIYRVHLATLSQQVGDSWRRIRPGSSIQFHGIELRSVFETGQPPVLRAFLDLALDGVRGVERGVLSQGELQSLALCLFLPTMMRPESPFGFAVIDDPVQVMDEHAVDGLAEVLGNAAKDLQLIVFTHDKRLLESLHWQGIKHTQINVTRAGESVVTCEPVSDPVSQRIADARMLAEEAAVDDEFRHRRNAAYQCRRAIEAACLRAVRGKFARQGLSHQQIESKVEVALRNKDTTTLRLLALAMFEDVGKQRDVRPRMKDNPDEWGKQQEIDTLAQVNALVHAIDLEAAIQSIVQAERDRHGRASDAEHTEREAHAEREARAAFGRDPRDLVNDVEQLVKAIERNCV